MSPDAPWRPWWNASLVHIGDKSRAHEASGEDGRLRVLAMGVPLSLTSSSSVGGRKVRFGEAPKPAREARALLYILAIRVTRCLLASQSLRGDLCVVRDSETGTEPVLLICLRRGGVSLSRSCVFRCLDRRRFAGRGGRASGCGVR
jgi:hypothetical protein